MVYTDHDKLAIVELKEKVDSISFEVLGGVLKERPANIVYCELKGKLYGLVSAGDVHRAIVEGKTEVHVNRKFTSVKPDDYMRARWIFKENEKINGLPVVDENRVLWGDYTRWDDLIVLKHLVPLMDHPYAAEVWGTWKKLALVRPCAIFNEKKKYFDKWEALLKDKGVQVECIDRMEVQDYFRKVDVILFVDEDELRGTITLFEMTCGKEKSACLKATTYKKYYTSYFWDKIENLFAMSISKKVLGFIQNMGAHVLALYYNNDNKSEYSKKLNRELREKYFRANVPVKGCVLPSLAKDFFEELYTEEYAEAILEHPICIENVGGANRLKYFSSRYYNTNNGERLTVDQPESYDRKVYFFGQCVILGIFVEDQNTIESLLQKKLNQKEIAAKVVNLACMGSDMDTLQRIIETPIEQDDIVVAYFRFGREIYGIRNLNLNDVVETRTPPAKWMTDSPIHCNHKINEMYCDAIYEKLDSVFVSSVVPDRKQIEMDKTLLVQAYFNRYFANFDSTTHGIIGTIIMNCNPFTKGHRYLIEEALKVVDYLIVFVVEENKSIFTHDERFSFVCEGVKDLPNVRVVPSGPYILSQTTFPEYFMKVADEDIVRNVEYDVTLFAEQIAPKLNITYRFVGEEPEDAVTNEYNLAMKRILPAKGINIVEIPRKENDKGIISASAVRRCLELGNTTELEDLVPESTKRILYWIND